MAILCKYIAVVRFQKVFGWRKHAQKARFTSQVLVEQNVVRLGPVQFVVVRNHRQLRTFYHLPSIQTIRVASLKVPFITLLKFCVNALEVIEVALE